MQIGRARPLLDGRAVRCASAAGANRRRWAGVSSEGFRRCSSRLAESMGGCAAPVSRLTAISDSARLPSTRLTASNDRNVRCAYLIRLVLVGAAAGSVPPDAYPQVTFARPVRILVPVAAGGTTDLTARLVANGIRESVGQPVVVENRPGATGRIAAEALKHAAADGTTFMMAPIVVTVLAPLVFRDLSYDPSKDFAPVAQVARYPFALAVRADHPARTVPEFVAWAKANRAQATFGTAGSGGVPHLLGMMVGRATGTDLVHVSYSSLAQVESELIGGQIPAAISAFADFLALERAGKLRIIATSGTGRSPAPAGSADVRRTGVPSGRRGRVERRLRAGGDAETADRSPIGCDRKGAPNARDPRETRRARRGAHRDHAGRARGDHRGRHRALGTRRQGCGICC